MVWRANGLAPVIGHRLPTLLRAAGLVDVQVEVHARALTLRAFAQEHKSVLSVP
jgi:hypothetical protein